MAYFPPTGSVVAFQSDSSKLQASVAGTVQIAYGASIATVHALDQQITTSSFGIVTDTIIHGRTTAGGGSYVEVKADPSGALVTALGSVVSFQGGAWTTSVVGTVSVGNSSVQVLNFPTSQNVSGSVVAFQGTSPWVQTGSVQGTVSVLGTVPVTQSTTPWIIGSVYGNISGSVAATITNTTLNVSGSVAAFQTGTWQPSALSYVTRNDAVASFLGGNLTTRPAASDSAGRMLTRPFAPEESRVEGYNSVVSTSVTTLVAAAGAGLRNYITDVWVANTGASATLVTFTSGGGASVLGYTIAPAGGGSNLPGLTTPIQTLANQTFDIQPATATSVLYVTVKGFKGP